MTFPAATAAETAPTVMVLPHEPELGPQRQCVDCLEWWPLDAEFFVIWAHWTSPRCRACHIARRDAAEAAERRLRATRAAERAARRASEAQERRERALRLRAAGLPAAIVARTLRVNQRTVHKWLSATRTSA